MKRIIYSFAISLLLLISSYASSFDRAIIACENKNDFNCALINSQKKLKEQLENGANKLELGKTYEMIGNYYYDLNKLNRAKTSFEKALRLYREGGADGRKLANIYSLLSSTAYAQGKFEEAIKLLNRAKDYLDIEKNGADLGELYINLGVIYATLKRFEDTKYYFNKALNIYKKTGLIKKENTGDILFLATRVLSDVGDKDELLKFYLFVIDAYERSNANRQKLIEPYNAVASIYLEKGNFNKALNFFNRALRAYKGVRNVDPMEVDTIKAVVGFLYLKKGEFKKAINHLSSAYKSYKKYLGENHPDTLRIKEGLEVAKEVLRKR